MSSVELKNYHPEITENIFPDEIILRIFSFLDLPNLNYLLVSDQFARIGLDKSFEHISIKFIRAHIVFGKAEWEKYHGPVEDEPPLPPLTLLKTLFKTHLLVFIPKTVGSKALTADLYKTLAEEPKGGGHPTSIYISEDIWRYVISTDHSHWVLHPRELLKETVYKPWDNSKQLVAQLNSEITGMLDSLISLGSRTVHTGEILFNRSFARCKENPYVAVGRYDDGGNLCACNGFSDGLSIGGTKIGVAAAPKL